MLINNFDILKNIIISFEDIGKSFVLTNEDINFLKTFNDFLKSETTDSIGIYSTDKKKLLKVQQLLISIVSLSSISNQFLVHKKNNIVDYTNYINKFFLIDNQQCKLLKVFNEGFGTIVEYEILNLRTKRKNEKNKKNAIIQEHLKKFESKNPGFLDDNKVFDKKDVTISDVNKANKFEDDWINLLLDPEDIYPDTNINLKKNSFTVSYLSTANNIRKIKKILIGTKKKNESKSLSELLLFDSNNKNILCPHVLCSSSIEKLESSISSANFIPTILFVESTKMLMDALDDSLYKKFQKKVVFLDPNDLATNKKDTKPNIEVLKNYDFKFIDIGKFDENSMRLIGQVNSISAIDIHQFTEPLIPRINTLIRKIKQDERFSYYAPKFFRLANKTLKSLFKSSEFIDTKSEQFKSEIIKISSNNYLPEVNLLKNMKEILIPYMELMKISKQNPGIRLKVLLDTVTTILKSFKEDNKLPITIKWPEDHMARIFNENNIEAGHSSTSFKDNFWIAIIYDKKESFYTKVEMTRLRSFFIGTNIRILFYDIKDDFDNDFLADIAVFTNLLKNDISTMINIQANSKFLIVDQYEFNKFKEMRDQFKEAKKMLVSNQFSNSSALEERNIFDNFKVVHEHNLTNLFDTELIENKIIDTYNFLNQKEEVSDYDAKWDYEELGSDLARNDSFNVGFTKEAYVFNFRLEKNNYDLVCEKGHKVLIYSLDEEDFSIKSVEKLADLSENFKVLLPINWDKELRFKISDQILKKDGEDLAKIQSDIALWKDAFSSLGSTEGGVESKAKEIIPNIQNGTIKNYLYDNEQIGPGKHHETHDLLTTIFNASLSEGLEVKDELVHSVEKSIKSCRSARQRVQGFIKERVTKNFNFNNSIYNDELIGEIGSFEFISCNLDKKIEVTQDKLNKLTKDEF